MVYRAKKIFTGIGLVTDANCGAVCPDGSKFSLYAEEMHRGEAFVIGRSIRA